VKDVVYEFVKIVKYSSDEEKLVMLDFPASIEIP